MKLVAKELGDQIRRARKAAGLVQKELAARVGVSRPMISRYETGKDKPSSEILASLANVLDFRFEVAGSQVIPQAPVILPPRPRQLELAFGKVRKFPRATVEIKPTRGRVVIRTTIPI